MERSVSVFRRPMSVTFGDDILNIRVEGRSIENGPHWLWWVILKAADETLYFTMVLGPTGAWPYQIRMFPGTG